MLRKVSMVVIDVVLTLEWVAVQSNMAMLLLVCMLVATMCTNRWKNHI